MDGSFEKFDAGKASRKEKILVWWLKVMLPLMIEVGPDEARITFWATSTEKVYIKKAGFVLIPGFTGFAQEDYVRLANTADDGVNDKLDDPDVN